LARFSSIYSRFNYNYFFIHSSLQQQQTKRKEEDLLN